MTAPTAAGIVVGASDRWGVFHRGSRLEAGPARPEGTHLRLAFPEALFHGLAVRQFGPIWQVALRLLEPTGRIELVEAHPTWARWIATWRG